MDLSFVLFAVVAFLAVVLSLEGVYNLWATRSSPEAKRIATRLEALAGEAITPASIERARQPSRMPRLNALLGATPFGARMLRFVTASAMAVSPAELIVMSVALGAQTYRVATAQRALAGEKLARAADQLAAQAETLRRVAAQQGVIHEAEKKTRAARADVVLADAATVRLRSRIAALGASVSAAPASSGAAAADPFNLLADVQRRIDEAAGQFAQIADDRGNAGTACQQSYDALTAK